MGGGFSYHKDISKFVIWFMEKSNAVTSNHKYVV